MMKGVNIGDYAKVQKAAAKMEEAFAMLKEIETTCGNIDEAVIFLGFATDEIRQYTQWAIDHYKVLDEEIKKVRETVPISEWLDAGED